MFKQFFLNPLYPYDKVKVNWLKAIFPIVIIVHHISNLGYTGSGLGFLQVIDAIIMPIFFAMSGYGLVICYKNNENYINGFLKRSLAKLFVPYLIALVSFVVYRDWGGKSDRIIKRKRGNVVCPYLVVHLDIILFLYFLLYYIQIL